MTPLIDVRDICKIYDPGENEVRALDHVSFAVERGEFVAIIGQSGSGKSTLMNTLGCIDSPTSGQYLLNGVDVATMSDNELLGVLGHEIGHVALKHTYRQMRSAMLTSAAFEGIASASSTAALLTDSQLGAIGQSMLSAQFSKKQETEADDYGYNFLCEAGKNPWAMAMAFEKLQSLEGGSTQSGPVSNLFSTHPDTATRISRMTQRAVQDGYQRPSN